MQLEFLRQHALATSISFGPVSRCDAITVLNCPAFAARNGPLLQQVGVPRWHAIVCAEQLYCLQRQGLQRHLCSLA